MIRCLMDALISRDSQCYYCCKYCENDCEYRCKIAKENDDSEYIVKNCDNCYEE